MNNEQLIIKYYMKGRFLANLGNISQWAKVTAEKHHRVTKTEITLYRVKFTEYRTSNEALKDIKRNGFVLVHKDSDGEVYSLPGEEFRKRYKGLTHVPEFN